MFIYIGNRQCMRRICSLLLTYTYAYTRIHTHTHTLVHTQPRYRCFASAATPQKINYSQ